MSFEISMIHAAAERIAPYIIKTPMIRLAQLDEYLGCEVYVKAECMQAISAFKIRGAMNALLSLSKDEMKNGIVTASSGNHGRGCAHAAKMLGIPATVVIPDTAPPVKVENIRRLGANIVRCPAVERFDVAMRISAETGARFIPPYDDETVMAGQGTCGLEIVEQLPQTDMVVVPLSGGGLLSGVAAAIKSEKPSITVVGSEPLEIPRYTASLAAGHPVEVEQRVTIADALVSNHPGKLCFPVIRDNVDKVVTASETAIKKAQKLLLLEGKIFAEASGCLGIAAVLDGTLKLAPGQKVCFLVSGGNCAIDQLVAVCEEI